MGAPPALTGGRSLTGPGVYGWGRGRDVTTIAARTGVGGTQTTRCTTATPETSRRARSAVAVTVVYRAGFGVARTASSSGSSCAFSSCRFERLPHSNSRGSAGGCLTRQVVCYLPLQTQVRYQDSTPRRKCPPLASRRDYWRWMRDALRNRCRRTLVAHRRREVRHPPRQFVQSCGLRQPGGRRGFGLQSGGISRPT